MAREKNQDISVNFRKKRSKADVGVLPKVSSERLSELYRKSDILGVAPRRLQAVSCLHTVVLFVDCVMDLTHHRLTFSRLSYVVMIFVTVERPATSVPKTAAHAKAISFGINHQSDHPSASLIKFSKKFILPTQLGWCTTFTSLTP